MAKSWSELEDYDLWRLEPDKLALMLLRNDTGRLGFALQLKFRQVYGRYPENPKDFDSAVAKVVAK